MSVLCFLRLWPAIRSFEGASHTLPTPALEAGRFALLGGHGLVWGEEEGVALLVVLIERLCAGDGQAEAGVRFLHGIRGRGRSALSPVDVQTQGVPLSGVGAAHGHGKAGVGDVVQAVETAVGEEGQGGDVLFPVDPL